MHWLTFGKSVAAVTTQLPVPLTIGVAGSTAERQSGLEKTLREQAGLQSPSKRHGKMTYTSAQSLARISHTPAQAYLSVSQITLLFN